MPQKIKMTLHRALTELKLIDSKITKSIDLFNPVAVIQKDKLILGHIKIEDFTKEVPSQLQSIEDLIKRKTAIKAAIVEANAKTLVKIGDIDYTIAEAINFKAVIEYKKLLLSRMKNFTNHVVGGLNKSNEQVEANLQKLIETMLGKDASKVNASDIEAVSKPYRESNTFSLVDPIKVQDKIHALEAEISAFEAEVDSCLSEINAITTIEI